MRSPLAIAVLALLSVAIVMWLWLAPGSDDDLAPIGITPGDGTVPAAPTTTELTGPGDAMPLPAGTVALRTRAATPDVGKVADAPTAWLKVVEHGSGRPLAGAAVRRVLNGAELAFTDAQGLAPLPLADAEQLAVVLDGYLLRMAPTRPGSSEAEPQGVALVRDTWSWRRRFHFPGANGEVFVRLRPLGKAEGKSPMPAGDALLQRAWSEHTMLAARPVAGDVNVQLGSWSADRSLRLTEGAEVRFLVPATYAIEAATVHGLVGSGQVVVAGAPGAAASDVTVAMQAGVFAAGVVTDLATGAPLPGALIVAQGGDPLGLQATSDAQGAFRLGPLPSGVRTLELRHGNHEPQAFGPVQLPLDTLRIPLRAANRTRLRGRVRTLPTLAPIADASVVWMPPDGTPVTARTGPDGEFTLAATGDVDARLVVQAPEHVARSELVAPGTPFADYDLFPADPAVRTQRGLTAQLQGVVLERDGTPGAGLAVRWVPATATPPAAVPGRRVIEGAVLALPSVTTTAADGSFTLETTQFGSGVLSTTGATLDVAAIAGRIRSELRLQR